MSPDRVDLVHENDTGRIALRLVEQVADPAGAYPDEHLHELGTADAEERHPGLAGDGLGQQGLACAGRTNQQHAFGNPGPQLYELLRFLQEFHDLGQFLLGLGDPGDIVESHRRFVAGKHASAALPERQCLAIAALGLSHQEIEKRSHENQGQNATQNGKPASPITGLLYRDTGLHDLLRGNTQVHEGLHHVRGAFFVGNRRLFAVFVVDLDLLPGNHHFFDLSIVDLLGQRGQI